MFQELWLTFSLKMFKKLTTKLSAFAKNTVLNIFFKIPNFHQIIVFPKLSLIRQGFKNKKNKVSGIFH